MGVVVGASPSSWAMAVRFHPPTRCFPLGGPDWNHRPLDPRHGRWVLRHRTRRAGRSPTYDLLLSDAGSQGVRMAEISGPITGGAKGRVFAGPVIDLAAH